MRIMFYRITLFSKIQLTRLKSFEYIFDLVKTNLFSKFLRDVVQA